MTIPFIFMPVGVEVTETIYPDADITDGNWVEIGNLTNNTDLHQFIDETTPFDNDGITTEATGGGRFLTVCGSPTDEQTGVWGLPDFTDPPAGTETFTFSFRARMKETFGTGHTVEGRIELLQGASTVIADSGYVSLGTSFTQDDTVLTLGEINSLLTDTSDMRVRVRARGCVNSFGDEADCEVSMVRLDVA